MERSLKRMDELQRGIEKLERGEDIEYEQKFWSQSRGKLEDYLKILQSNNEGLQEIFEEVVRKSEHFYSKLIIYRHKLVKMRTFMLENSAKIAGKLVDSIQQTVICSHYWLTQSLTKINQLPLTNIKKSSSSIATISSLTSLDQNVSLSLHH